MLNIDTVYTKIADLQSIYVASSGFSAWNEHTTSLTVDHKIYILINEATSTKNLDINPRITISFSHNNLRCTGIVHAVSDIPTQLKDKLLPTTRCYLLTPYRFYSDGELYLELRKEGWTTKPLEAYTPWCSFTLPDKIAFWKKTIRIISLPLSAFPITVAALLAWTIAPVSILTFICCLLGGICAHMGVNLISDYYDYKRGVDTPDALSSHLSTLVDESIDPDNALLGAFVCLAITVFCGGYLLFAVGLPVVLLGIIGIIGGYAYTGGIFGLKYRGLGEVLIFLLMGPLMVLGTYYVLTNTISLLVFLLSCCIGLLVASVTLSNNLRDMLYDTKAGYKTLPLRIGIVKAKQIYFSIIYLPYILILIGVLCQPTYFPLLLTYLSIPQARQAQQQMQATENTVLAFYTNSSKFIYPLNAIKQHAKFCTFLCLGLLIVKALDFLM